MTKKTYIATADILSSYKDLIADEFTFEDLVNDFAVMFSEDNPNFNSEKFFDACKKDIY